jgi:hypothetical protein
MIRRTALCVIALVAACIGWAAPQNDVQIKAALISSRWQLRSPLSKATITFDFKRDGTYTLTSEQSTFAIITSGTYSVKNGLLSRVEQRMGTRVNGKSRPMPTLKKPKKYSFAVKFVSNDAFDVINHGGNTVHYFKVKNR